MKSFSRFVTALQFPESLSLNMIVVGARRGVNPGCSQVSTRLINYFGFKRDASEYVELIKSSHANVTYFNATLLDQEKQVTLNITRQLGCSSTLEPDNNLFDKNYLSEGGGIVSKQSAFLAIDCFLCEDSLLPDAIKIEA